MEAKKRKIDTEPHAEANAEASVDSVTADAEIARPQNVDVGLLDIDVGISTYVNPDLPGFTGKIKQRYSDFQVNEIGLDNEVVVLKHTKVPDELKETPAPKPEPKDDESPKVEPVVAEKNEFTDKLAEILGAKFVDDCFELLQKGGEKVKTDPINDKDERTQIHTLIRDAFASKLDSTTADGRIVVQKPNKRSRRGAKKKNAGPKDDYLHFTLYKENKDTLEAVSLIARILHVPAKTISFAGTKDRRAATTQRVAWRGGTPSRLEGLNQALRDSIRVGDYSYAGSPIKLGDLKGNQFWIVIRDISPTDTKAINTTLESLRDSGFINYFGLQRFGTFSVPSHTIGKLILRNDFDAALNALLNPQSIASDDSREAREVWANEQDAAKALELMPKRCVAESCLLAALKDSPNSLNALMRIPHSLKTMYVHAYQSYIWNRAASRRLELSSKNILVGDLVMTETGENIKRARPVTQEDIEEGKLTIQDVVLPTPGFDVLYPENLVSFYEESMSEDNIDCHDMRRKVKEFSLFGSYRHLLAKPLGVEWFIRNFENDDDAIVYTDPEMKPEGKLSPVYETNAPPRTALILKLALQTSQYATMAVREVMKCDTSRHGSMYYNESTSRSAARD